MSIGGRVIDKPDRFSRNGDNVIINQKIAAQLENPVYP